jgi:hypothetical protein
MTLQIATFRTVAEKLSLWDFIETRLIRLFKNETRLAARAGFYRSKLSGFRGAVTADDVKAHRATREELAILLGFEGWVELKAAWEAGDVFREIGLVHLQIPRETFDQLIDLSRAENQTPEEWIADRVKKESHGLVARSKGKQG